MTEYLPELLTVALVHLLAMMSPGPDFVLISRNSLLHSRRAGIYAGLGIAAGTVVHVMYSLVGIGLLISKSIVVFSILKFAGAAYLIYIGYQSLRSAPAAKHERVETAARAAGDIGRAAAFRMGFLTNILNPKVTLFFLALFTQVIDPHTPKLVQVAYGAEMVLANAAYWSLVAVLLSHPRVKERFLRIQHRLEQVFGAILIGLGIKVALSSSR